MPLAMDPETYGHAAPKCNVLLHTLAVNSSEKRPERATFLRQAYEELAVALVKGNAMCGYKRYAPGDGGCIGTCAAGRRPTWPAGVSSRGLSSVLA